MQLEKQKNFQDEKSINAEIVLKDFIDCLSNAIKTSSATIIYKEVAVKVIDYEMFIIQLEKFKKYVDFDF